MTPPTSPEPSSTAKGLRTVLQAVIAVPIGITAVTGPHGVTVVLAAVDLGIIIGAAFGKREGRNA